jgi:hypothetical protein
MEGGDLASDPLRREIYVLEGTLAVPQYVQTGRIRRSVALSAPETWKWDIGAIKALLDRTGRLGMLVDVITYTSYGVADAAAEFFAKYDITVSSVEYIDYDMFCESLKWRVFDVLAVYDSDPERARRYGQMGVVTEGIR